MVKLDTLLGNKEQYYGKTVTVDGEMHRIFTDRVFTIEDDDFFRDDDLLIISDVPREQAVEALQDSIEPGKDVRVTGFVRSYDRAELECLYGPLHLESREGHSFTKGPVLIVEKTEKTAQSDLEKPTPAPEVQPAPMPEPSAVPVPESANEPIPEPPEEEEATLPATAGGLALTGLVGLISLVTACGIQLFRR